MALQEETKIENNQTKGAELIKFVHGKLLSLHQRDESKFPTVLFHNAKGIGIIHIGYDELNNAVENIGHGIIFTHWKNNEKRASGPIIVNVMIGDDYNKDLLNNKLIKYKDNSFLIVLKEEAQIHDLCKEKHHNIKLGVDYNIEGIAKDDYDGILIFEITHLNNQLKSIPEIDFLRGLVIKINNVEMHKYYNNNKFSMKDVYEGTILVPLNDDYVECERLIYEKFMSHFVEKDIKKGTLGQKVRPHHKSCHPMRQIWHKTLFERPIDRLMDHFKTPFDMGYDDTKDEHDVECIHNKKNHIIPNCNVIEKNNEYKISCDLPGIDKNSISVNFNSESGIIEIEAHRESEEKDDKNNRYVEEIEYGNYYRRFSLPQSIHVNNNNVKAKYNNGVLILTIPKNEQLSQSKDQYRVNVE